MKEALLKSLGTAPPADGRHFAKTPARSLRPTNSHMRPAPPGWPLTRRNQIIAGVVLVLAAAIGTFVAASGNTKEQAFATAARDMPAGTQLTQADIAVVKLKGTSAIAQNSALTTAQVLGGTLLGPVKAGELLQPGDITAPGEGARKPEISFPLPAASALDGDIRSGETVDILVTDEGARATSARTVVSDARVKKVSRKDDIVTVTLEVDSRTAAASAAGALGSGRVSLLRTTGLGPEPTTTAAPTRSGNTR